ncbi:adenosylcobinamide-phosphate synthase CbiB [Parathalassolituus penaei]|uniref:Cobalamin biosynthesis protein CobD n=1 Tax=Parathalassolituus penaei TaxID=2997323 RepID=A0A9X3ED37_9GAMM|nr:adenosylcobinamide-phosphate synthase CbiB [Parathalassolituus penaei]MCY0965367.1 adenosylcobinamide-phosphate synthase CbiB [Parathalassolituus penaei]
MELPIGHLVTTVYALIAALVIDRMFGEPSRWHPLIGFGKWAAFCRRRLQKSIEEDRWRQRWFGVLAWLITVLPPVLLLALLLELSPDWLHFVISTLVLYFTVGWQSLRLHALAIAVPLCLGHLQEARNAVGRIVSRDTDQLNEEEIAKAGIESVLENGSDAVFAPIFWFLILGPVGALLYRFANTLDAMWGYKTEFLLHFGWCAARVDDVLNFIPARLVVLTYAACGNSRTALKCARQQGSNWKSPNAGPVMAAGAGALQLQLGGKAQYFGEIQQRPPLGEGQIPVATDLDRAIWLVDKGVYLWVAVVGIAACVF